MCSRFSLSLPPGAVRAWFGCRNDPDLPARADIAPTQAVPVVRQTRERGRELVFMRWGLIPSWVKDPGDFATLINARAETAADKPSFRVAMRRRRCLVPADGFYEWGGEKGRKRPFHVRRAEGSGEPLAFAALWEHWQGADGSEIESVAILTTAANADVAAVHDRMPAILDPEDFDAWLDCDRLPLEEVIGLLRPAPEGTLETVGMERGDNGLRRGAPRGDAPLQEDLPFGL